MSTLPLGIIAEWIPVTSVGPPDTQCPPALEPTHIPFSSDDGGQPARPITMARIEPRRAASLMIPLRRSMLAHADVRDARQRTVSSVRPFAAPGFACAGNLCRK